jgi:hypothetical protein
MKSNLLKIILAIVLVGGVLVVYFHSRHTPDVQPQAQTQAPETNSVTFVSTNKMALGMRARDLTPEQMSEFEKRFNERIKPAIDKWASAYAGHLPFDPSILTIDKFHSVNQGAFFTFMIGADTFTVFDTVKETKVFYFMAKQASIDLNTIPTTGTQRNLTTPIKADEVLKMATADTGLTYELKDVVIKPTATFCNIDGGAYVEVGIKYKNGLMLVDKNNLSFTMDSTGKIVSYMH